MRKKYIVCLTDQERSELVAVVKKLKGTSQKVRRAQILLKADAEGPHWTDQRIAEAFGCRTKTVENVRQRLVERGFVAHARRAQPRGHRAATAGKQHPHQQHRQPPAIAVMQPDRQPRTPLGPLLGRIRTTFCFRHPWLSHLAVCLATAA